MRFKRIIARLDCKNDSLVKGIQMEGLRVLGRPDTFAKLYSDEGVDEIVYMDVVASLYGRNGLNELISRTSELISVPLSVGGGIRSVEDVRKILRCGADKVIVNTAIVDNSQLLEQLVDQFGSSTISVAVEAVRQEDGKYLVFTNNGREYTGLEVCDWMHTVQDKGAGEILLTSVDRDGTGSGLDCNLLRLKEGLSIPVVVHGGVGNYDHVKDAFTNLDCDGVAIASMFHYHALKHLPLDAISGNTSFLQSGNTKKKISPISIKECKDSLISDGILLRSD